MGPPFDCINYYRIIPELVLVEGFSLQRHEIIFTYS